MHTPLNSVMESLTFPLCPFWGVAHPFVQHLYSVHTLTPESLGSRLGDQLDCLSISVLVSKSPLFYLIMKPKCKSSEVATQICQKAAMSCFL